MKIVSYLNEYIDSQALTLMESGYRYTGNLRTVPFGKVLLLIQQQEESGILHLRRDKVYKRLLFKDGQPVFAESNLARESFFRQCLSRKLLTAQQTMKLADLAVTSQISLEQAAAQQGLMDGKRLKETNRDIAKLRILEIFSWKQGEYFFHFDGDAESGGESWIGPYNPVELIREGIARYTDSARARIFLKKDFSRIPKLTESHEDLISKIRLKPTERKLLELIDGKHTMEDILAESTTSMKETLKFCLMLVVLGYAVLAENEKPPKAHGKDASDQAKDFTVDVLEFTRLVETEHPRIVGGNFFEIFGISRDFKEDDLRKTYYGMAQKFRPEEHYQRAADVIKEKSDRIFEYLSRAYEALSEWNKDLRLGKFEDFKRAEDRLRNSRVLAIKAEMDFMRGKQYIESDELEQAAEMFEAATSKINDEGEYWAYLGNALFKSDGEQEKTFNYLRRSVAYDSNLVAGYKFLADYYQDQDKYEAALDNLRRALRLKPDSKSLRRLYKKMEQSASKSSTKQESRESEKKKIERRMNEFLEMVKNADHFQVLGLERGASQEDVRRAYFHLAKEFHPDRLAKISSTLVQHPIAEQVFQRINESYEILASDKRRNAYERTLVIREEAAKMQTVQERKEDERIFRRGLAALNEGDHRKAIELFKQAIDSRPDEARYQAYLNWAEFSEQAADSGTDAAGFERKFREVSQMDPKCEDTYVLWGKMHRKLENVQSALTHFQKAVAINANCVEALREIRLINMRQQRQQKSGGIDLKGLFGKKKTK